MNRRILAVITISSILLTIAIIFRSKILVVGMICVGYFIYPEASLVLRHYCFGNGETIILDNSYISKSPVVLKELKKLKKGQKKIVWFRQREDWRLSYAINGFTMERKKDSVLISQWMQFDRTNKVVTYFGPVAIPDNIVHTFICTPYLVKCEWATK
jgi:hypothetical protein